MTHFENKCCSVAVLTNGLNKAPTLVTILDKYFLKFVGNNLADVTGELIATYYFVIVSHNILHYQTVYQFSKVEKNSLENDKGSEPFDKPCKGLPFVAEGSQ